MFNDDEGHDNEALSWPNAEHYKSNIIAFDIIIKFLLSK